MINVLKFFHVGSVWIYSLYPLDYVPGNLYCHKTTYQFAFGMTTAVWAAAAFMIILGCCLGVVRRCRSDDTVILCQNPYGATIEECPASDVRVQS